MSDIEFSMNKKSNQNKKNQKRFDIMSIADRNILNEENIEKLVKDLTNAFVDDFKEEQNKRFAEFFSNSLINNKQKRLSDRQINDLLLEEITK